MYIVNGITYANSKTDDIEIKAVKPLEDMIMLLTFTSGETRLFDATILNGPAFEPLKNAEIFQNPSIEYGVVT